MIFPHLILKLERWKFNEEYGIYVSNLGHFKNRKKKDLSVMIGGYQNNGYCAVKTEKGIRQAHRIVMLTWKPVAEAEKLTVDHLDHNKRNNALDNLEWVTAAENLRRAKKDQAKAIKDVTASVLENQKDETVFYVDDKSFPTMEEAYSYAKNELDNANVIFSEKRLEKILVNRLLNIGQECRYGGLVFKAEKRDINQPASFCRIPAEKTAKLIEKEVQKTLKVEDYLAEMKNSQNFTYKVNSKTFDNMGSAYNYAVSICKSAFLMNLDANRIAKIYASSAMNVTGGTSFCGIHFSARRKELVNG